jgi:hypothetical protein
MSRWVVLGLPVSLAIAVVAASGCYMDDGSGSNTTPLTALPCDVAQALSSCQACHGPTPAVGAPFTLVSLTDLTSTSPTYADQTVAQRAVARMSDPSIPMPPHPLDPSIQTDIDAIQAWIDAGYPAGSCTPPAGGINPFDTPMNACTNGKSSINYGSSQMFPGRACIDCHGSQMTFGGTVFPSAHETDVCVGSKVSGATITLTDANNKQVTATVNSAGNFYSTTSITPPYTVKLSYQGRERDMTGLVTSATDGNCNSCHSMEGTNGAPGRIVLP